jgi:hypothetical protein
MNINEKENRYINVGKHNSKYSILDVPKKNMYYMTVNDGRGRSYNIDYEEVDELLEILNIIKCYEKREEEILNIMERRKKDVGNI